MEDEEDNNVRSRLDFEQNKARSFVRDQIQNRLRSDALSLTSNVPDKLPSPVDEGGITEAAFNKAIARMTAASGGKVTVKSGKRTTERQAQLWAEALKKYGDPEIADNWVARPGTSNHEKGLAADLAYADAAAKAWAHQHAAEFGIQFPLANEDWHAELINGAEQTPRTQPSQSVSQTTRPQFELQSGWGRATDKNLVDFVKSRVKTPTQPQYSGPGSVANAGGRKTTGDQFLDEIIYGTGSVPGESHFRTDAKNPQSSAFGIGQLIESNRQRFGQQLGIDPNTTDEAQQLALMNAYIKERYGSSQAAAEFRRQHGWY